MRTITEIKTSMTDAFMADATIQNLYGLSEGDRFEDRFSSVSLENILFHIVASCMWVLESLMDRHRSEVEELASTAVVASVPWYYAKARAYQHGDKLEIDPETMGYGYAATDTTKQVVQYAAVRDRGTSISLLVSGADADGRPTKLGDDVMVPFRAYMNQVKVAGVVLTCESWDADKVMVLARIKTDPMVLNAQGERIAGSGKPVVDAINGYLRNIVYGGALNKTKLVDAIQAAEGVVDVVLTDVLYSTDGLTYAQVTGNDYGARSGCFVSVDLDKTLQYV